MLIYPDLKTPPLPKGFGHTFAPSAVPYHHPYGPMSFTLVLDAPDNSSSSRGVELPLGRIRLRYNRNPQRARR